MRVLMKSAKARAGSWEALSKEWGLSRSYIHGVLAGSRPVSDYIAGKLGYRRIERVVFEPIQEAAE